MQKCIRGRIQRETDTGLRIPVSRTVLSSFGRGFESLFLRRHGVPRNSVFFNPCGMIKSMKSLLEYLDDAASWEEYLRYRNERMLRRKDADALADFIREQRYRPMAGKILAGEDVFAVPVRRRVNKGKTGRKRIVYTFPETEAFLLKHLEYRMDRYEGALSDACWSFRRGKSVRGAFRTILRIPDLDRKYVLKADIHNYFNSIPADRLVQELAPVLADDPALFRFLKTLLLRNCAIEDGRIVSGPCGVLAGTAISVFLANYWLTPVDEYFVQQGIPYCRYSDDMILFADNASEREELESELRERIAERGLVLNPDKTCRSDPGEAWEYLGFRYDRGEITLADNTVRKLKGKIRRKARALYRWRMRKHVAAEKAIKRMIRVFDRKLFEGDREDRMCWTGYYFPVLTTERGLQEIDRYMVQYLRYIQTGRHTAKNYALRYETLRETGYRSLVHAYYERKKETG